MVMYFLDQFNWSCRDSWLGYSRDWQKRMLMVQDGSRLGWTGTAGYMCVVVLYIVFWLIGGLLGVV